MEFGPAPDGTVLHLAGTLAGTSVGGWEFDQLEKVALSASILESVCPHLGEPYRIPPPKPPVRNGA